MILFLHSHHHAARWHIWRTRPLNVLASWGNSYFSARLKIRRQLDVREANKNKRGREKGRGAEKSFGFWGGQEFYRLFEAGYLIIHLMLQGELRQSVHTLMHDRFYSLCVKKVCHNTWIRLKKCNIWFFQGSLEANPCSNMDFNNHVYKIRGILNGNIYSSLSFL